LSDPLAELRSRLDAADDRILAAIADRERLVAEIARLKANAFDRLRDLPREEALLARVSEHGRAAGLDAFFVTRVFREIVEHSLRLQQEHLVERQNPDRAAQQRLVIAYQGTAGAYSHLAASRYFGPRSADVAFHGFNSFREMLEAVRDGRADYAVLPIENTTAGSINEAYDLLAQMNLALVGEEVQRVDHCLLALEPVPVAHIRRVFSHPQALAQCSDFLAALDQCHAESFADTAMAAEKVRADQDLSQAAIASEEAGRLYGLHVIKRDIANQKENFTRFVVVAARPVQYDLRIPCKTSLLFATRDEEGALLACLNVFAQYHLNLTKLESRPRPNTPWEYLFYVDFEGNLADPRVQQALRDLTARTSFQRVLGSYPARTTRDAQPAEPRPQTPALAPGPHGTPTGPHAEPSKRAAATARKAAAESPPSLDPAVVQTLEKKPYRLVSRTQRAQDTQIRVRAVVIGGSRPVIIAGPCSVESREQILACARWVRDCGGDLLRGGCFKPRTSPYDFQGLGYDGLDMLEEAARAFDLPIVTEVLHPADVEKVARKADVLQLGARNMQNFALLKEVGRVDRPVLLKRGMMASIDEWLAAAEYILAQGNQQVVLCERGIRTFETATRNTLDLSAIPVVRERTHLPVIVDPSHACGTRRWVPAMTRAALASGADGVMVEFHPDPEKALSDGPQALTFDSFRELARTIRSAG
jgi:chorismate mutase/prephenate dehydratase